VTAEAGDAEVEEDPRKTRILRRRSTKSFNPAELRRWESVVSRRRSDVFFSLHLPDADVHDNEPLYISEIVEKSMNPDFQCFGLAPCGSAVGRLDRVAIRVWADSGGGWKLLIDADVYLGALVHLGESLEDWRFPLPKNAVVWQLSDGVYTSFWDGEMEVPKEVTAAAAEAAVERGSPTMVGANVSVALETDKLTMAGRLPARTMRS